ncbi:hypothetical protein RHOFW510R12_07910 [Rhodanobacter sp. FW510-R12]|nr:hypothetical protein RhoFW510T8_02140 [Rhodanobacter sp. FW510-T8]KZC29466.1 hypothetical protein RhoFW510R10_05635 [Rhodanobacter sp. FW510-R10]
MIETCSLLGKYRLKRTGIINWQDDLDWWLARPNAPDQISFLQFVTNAMSHGIPQGPKHFAGRGFVFCT